MLFALSACGSSAKKSDKPEPPAWSPFDTALTKLIEAWSGGKADESMLTRTRAHFSIQTWDKVQVGERKGVEERVFIKNKDAASVVETAAMMWDRKRIPRALGLQLRGISIDKVRQWLLEMAPRFGGRYFGPDRDTYVNEKKPATALLPRATLQVHKNEKGVLVFVVGLRRYPDEILIDLSPARFSDVRNRWREPSLRGEERKTGMVELQRLTGTADEKLPSGAANPPWRVAYNTVGFMMHTPGLYGAELSEAAAALLALPKGSWDAAVVKHLGPLLREAGCGKSMGKALSQPRNTRAAYLATHCDWRGKRDLGASKGKLALWQVMLAAVIDHLAEKRDLGDWPLHTRARRSLLRPSGNE